MSSAFLYRKAIMSTQLFDPRKTKKISLPSYPDVEIEVYCDLKTNQINELQKIENDYDRGIEIIRFLIKSWSFVDKDNKQIEVTSKVLGELPAKDFTFLMTNVSEMMENVTVKKKKNLKK